MLNFVNNGTDDAILKSLPIDNCSEDLVKAMSRQGLVQKDVTVQGKNGKTFTRKQWVKASDKDSSVSDKVQSDKKSSISQDTSAYYKISGKETVQELQQIRQKAYKEMSDTFKKYQAAVKANKPEASTLGISAQARQKYVSELDAYIKERQKEEQANKKPTLDDIQTYGFDSSTSTGDPTYLKIGNDGYYKIKENKWQHNPLQSSAIGGTYTDSQIFDMIEKTSEKIEVRPSANSKERKKMKPWHDKVQNGNFTAKQKSVLDYGVTEKHDRVFQKNGELTTGTWDAVDKAKKNGWEDIGGLTDILNDGKLPDNNQDSQSASGGKSDISFDKPADGDTKKALSQMLASGKSRQDIMDAAKSAGITWKENDHEGINWMRASMAIQKHMKDGASQDKSSSNNNSQSGGGQTVKQPDNSQKKVVKNVTVQQYDDYNARRYSKPWIALVDSNGKIDFSKDIGTYSGAAGQAGELYVYEPEEGQVYAYGQKDTRGNNGGYSYLKYTNGSFVPVLKSDLTSNLKGAQSGKNVTIMKVDSYNARRYSKPWVALVNSKGKPDFSQDVGKYSGDDNGGSVYVYEPKDGQVYMFGQKDYRGNNSVSKFAVYKNGEFQEIDKKEITKYL